MAPARGGTRIERSELSRHRNGRIRGTLLTFIDVQTDSHHARGSASNIAAAWARYPTIQSARDGITIPSKDRSRRVVMVVRNEIPDHLCRVGRTLITWGSAPTPRLGRSAGPPTPRAASSRARRARRRYAPRAQNLGKEPHSGSERGAPPHTPARSLAGPPTPRAASSRVRRARSPLCARVQNSREEPHHGLERGAPPLHP